MLITQLLLYFASYDYCFVSTNKGSLGANVFKGSQNMQYLSQNLNRDEIYQVATASTTHPFLELTSSLLTL